MFIFRINFQFQWRQLALEGKYVLLYQSWLIGTMMMKLCVSNYVCGVSECNARSNVCCAECVCVCVFPGGVVSV